MIIQFFFSCVSRPRPRLYSMFQTQAARHKSLSLQGKVKHASAASNSRHQMHVAMFEAAPLSC